MRWLRRDPVVRALKHAPRASDEIAEVLQATPMLVLYSELLPVRVPKEEDRATVLTWATERLLPRDRRLSYPARERELRNAILYEWRHHVRGTLETQAQKDLWLDVFSQTHDRRWMYDETWEESGRARAPEPPPPPIRPMRVYKPKHSRDRPRHKLCNTWVVFAWQINRASRSSSG